MIHVNGFISQQGKQILGNKRYALLYAVIFALFPYTTWLSLSVVALVTLRKGWREGALLVMPVSTTYLGMLLVHEPTMVAVINTLLTFLPCYIAACALGWSVSWRAVAGVFFLLTGISAIALQIMLPEFIVTQYQYLTAAIAQAHPDLFVKALKDANEFGQLVFANYFFGLQMISVVLSAILPLMFARSIQSRLYNPGGFRQEMLALRSNKLGLLIMGMLLIAVNQDKLIAMNLLPLLVFYFSLAGLSLSFHTLAQRKIRGRVVLLIAPLIALPFVMIPVYLILASVDSLFNLRLYLSSNAGKTT